MVVIDEIIAVCLVVSPLDASSQLRQHHDFQILVFRKTARYNGKKYEATGKTELEAMTKLAEKLSAVKGRRDRIRIHDCQRLV